MSSGIPKCPARDPWFAGQNVRRSWQTFRYSPGLVSLLSIVNIISQIKGLMASCQNLDLIYTVSFDSAILIWIFLSVWVLWQICSDFVHSVSEHLNYEDTNFSKSRRVGLFGDILKIFNRTPTKFSFHPQWVFVANMPWFYFLHSFLEYLNYEDTKFSKSRGVAVFGYKFWHF